MESEYTKNQKIEENYKMMKKFEELKEQFR